MTTLLAQALDNAAFQERDPSVVWIWSGIAIVVILVLIAAIAAIRKKYFPSEERKIDATPAGFGISQLKELYDQGLLSDDEFNAAKAKIVAESHAAFMARGKGKDKDKGAAAKSTPPKPEASQGEAPIDAPLQE